MGPIWNARWIAAGISSVEGLVARYQCRRCAYQSAGSPSVKTWAEAQDEETFHISVLTLAEYDKGIHNLPPDHEDRPRYIAARDALAERFSRRVLSLDDNIVRQWGCISGEVKRESGHAPPVIDIMLAATAINHDLYFVTRNVRDTRPSGTTIFDP